MTLSEENNTTDLCVSLGDAIDDVLKGMEDVMALGKEIDILSALSKGYGKDLRIEADTFQIHMLAAQKLARDLLARDRRQVEPIQHSAYYYKVYLGSFKKVHNAICEISATLTRDYLMTGSLDKEGAHGVLSMFLELMRDLSDEPSLNMLKLVRSEADELLSMLRNDRMAPQELNHFLERLHIISLLFEHARANT